MGAAEIEKDENARKEEFHTIIKDRLFRYIREENINQEELSKRLGVSSTTVSRWVNQKTSMPPVYQLPNIARVMGITVDSLLSGRDISIDRDMCSTYSRAFLSLIELSDRHLIPPASDDPFLNWLLTTKLKIDVMQMVSADKKNAWLDKVLSDFNRPILSPYLTQFIELFLYVYREINEYDTYLSVFDLMQGYGDGSTKDEVDGLIRRWHDAAASGSDTYRHLTVPYGGIMYALDEDGNACVTKRPEYVEAQPDPNDGYDLFDQ